LVHGDRNILSLAYIIFKKFDFDQITPGVWTIFHGGKRVNSIPVSPCQRGEIEGTVAKEEKWSE